MTGGLRQGAILEMCIELYHQHRDDGTGCCVACAAPLDCCAARRNCEKVMLAAGLDPTKFS